MFCSNMNYIEYDPLWRFNDTSSNSPTQIASRGLGFLTMVEWCQPL